MKVEYLDLSSALFFICFLEYISDILLVLRIIWIVLLIWEFYMIILYFLGSVYDNHLSKNPVFSRVFEVLCTP